MNKPGNGNTNRPPVRQPVLLGLFAGTVIGAGYLLSGIPNVELMTLITALAGAVLGARAGFAVGLVAMIVYSLGSPYGLPVPVMLAAQALGLGLAGVGGGLAAPHLHRLQKAGRVGGTLVLAGALGLAATLLFDLLTNLAIIVSFDTPALVVLTMAVPFFLTHAVFNWIFFTVMFPLLLPRLAGLKRSPLVGRSGGGPVLMVAILAVLGGMGVGNAAAQNAVTEADSLVAAHAPADTLGVFEADSLVAPPADPVPLAGPALAFGWKRPLWQPFAPRALDWLDWYSPWMSVRDGGLGAASMLLGEATTSPTPLMTRDGIPLGTGHVLADDLSLVPTENLVFSRTPRGLDHWGGTDGLVALATDDDDPGRAASGYRGIKGNHETYFRAIHVLTPQAAWRAAFEFEESLDNEAYNFTELSDPEFAASGGEFPGHGKIRQSRTRLFRQLGDDDSLVVEYSNGRKTKDSLPAYGADHQEIWDDGLAVTLHGRLGDWRLNTALFWKNRDVEWGDRDTTLSLGTRRKVETGREGLTLALTKADLPENAGSGPSTGVSLQVLNWRVYDKGVDPAWVGDFPVGRDGQGSSSRLVGHTGFALGAADLGLAVAALWDRHAGLAPEVSLNFGAKGAAPWWRLDLSHGGRAPRSDELLTPLLRVVAERKLILLPNPDLKREKTSRAGLVLQGSVLGLDLAVDGSVRRLTDGIAWQQSQPAGNVGRWGNGLDLDAARISGTLGRQGRFLGWGRLMVEGTWQTFEEKRGQASLLPPERYLRFHAMWENHFFQEDGILQLALLTTYQGAMADPWDVTREYELDARTVHDLVVGFRLLGAHLSLAARNLTGQKTRLTSGALSTGREIDMRLLWNFSY